MKPGLSGNILLFLCIFSLVACGSSDGVSVDCPDGEKGENWVWTGKVCSLRKDGFNWSVSSIAPALDGSDDLYAVGGFTHFKKRAVKYIARLNNDGSLDRGFDSDTDFFPPQIIESAIDGSGDVYVGGYLSYNGPTLPIRGIARLNLDGSLDRGFDTGAGIGRQVSTIAPAIDGSGDVYVRAINTNNQDVIRLNDDGSIDTGFRIGEGFNLYCCGHASDAANTTDGSGDIYVAGDFTHYNSTPVVNLIRLTVEGALVK